MVIASRVNAAAPWDGEALIARQRFARTIAMEMEFAFQETGACAMMALVDLTA